MFIHYVPVLGHHLQLLPASADEVQGGGDGKESGGEDYSEADAGALCGFLRSVGNLVTLWGLCGAP